MKHMATVILTAWIIGECTLGGMAAVVLVSLVQRVWGGRVSPN
jgi:hypothetical protein